MKNSLRFDALKTIELLMENYTEGKNPVALIIQMDHHGSPRISVLEKLYVESRNIPHLLIVDKEMMGRWVCGERARNLIEDFFKRWEEEAIQEYLENEWREMSVKEFIHMLNGNKNTIRRVRAVLDMMVEPTGLIARINGEMYISQPGIEHIGWMLENVRL